MFVLNLIATLNFIVFLASPHLVNALLQHPQPSSGTFQSETNFFNSKFEPCLEGDCLCSAFVTNCSSTKIFSFPPNNDVINSYHSICVIRVLGENCGITLSGNFISNIPNMRSISFDCNCDASDGCIHYDGPSFNSILHVVNNSICWLVTTSLPTASIKSPTNTTTATTRTTTTTTTITPTTNDTMPHSTSSTSGKESTPASWIASKTFPPTSAEKSATAGTTSGTALLQSPVKTAVCTDQLNQTYCEVVKAYGWCVNNQERQLCEQTCDPACGCTDQLNMTYCDMAKISGLCWHFRAVCEKTCNPACGVYTCKPGYGVGTNFTKDHFGVETCCDVIDNCDDLIAIANATQNSPFNTKYDVCIGVTSGLLFSLCSFSCGGCRIGDDKLSGLDYHKVCHDNYDTIKMCIPLLKQNFCDIENAKESCWQTCNKCIPNITLSSPETGSAMSPIWTRNLPRNSLKKIKEKNY